MVKFTAAIYCMAIFLISCTADGVLVARFIDVGQGDATLLVMPNNATILIDGGGNSRLSKSKLLDALSDANVSRIDAIIATHGDLDHIGGLSAVLEEVPVGSFFWNCFPCSTAACRSLDNSLAERGINKTCLGAGDLIQIDERVRLEVMSPKGRQRKDNDNSITLSVRHGDMRMLLLADCEEDCMRSMKIGRVDILKAGHHGSDSSSGSWFLKKAKPKDIVISVGKNSFGHPGEEILDWAEREDAAVWRTDQQGTIRVISSGKEYRVRC